MTKGSWKLRSLPGAAEALRTTPSLRAAAKKLGVHVSTLSRAVKAGTLPAPGERTPSTERRKRRRHRSFAEWARATYELTRAEDELVTLAQQALDIASDPKMSPTVRLQAISQARATLRELQLPPENAEHGDAETTTVRRFPRSA